MKKIWMMTQLVWMLGGGPVLALMSLTMFSWKISIVIFGIWMIIWIWALCIIAVGSSEEIKKFIEG